MSTGYLRESSERNESVRSIGEAIAILAVERLNVRVHFDSDERAISLRQSLSILHHDAGESLGEIVYPKAISYGHQVRAKDEEDLMELKCNNIECYQTVGLEQNKDDHVRVDGVVDQKEEQKDVANQLVEVEYVVHGVGVARNELLETGLDQSASVMVQVQSARCVHVQSPVEQSYRIDCFRGNLFGRHDHLLAMAQPVECGHREQEDNVDECCVCLKQVDHGRVQEQGVHLHHDHFDHCSQGEHGEKLGVSANKVDHEQLCHQHVTLWERATFW